METPKEGTNIPFIDNVLKIMYLHEEKKRKEKKFHFTGVKAVREAII